MAADSDSFVSQDACTETRTQILDSQQMLHEKLDSIEKRLFRDNGSVSIQTRLDRHEQILRVVLWIVGILGGTFLAACGSGLVIVVRELVVRGAM